MLLNADPRTLILVLGAVLVATTCHEFAHALAADRLGDPTPRRLGRLTLNPFVHLDLLGTLFFVLFGFGWARPVPVDPRTFASPRKGVLLVAVAGPLANLTVAFVVGTLMQVQVDLGSKLVADFVSWTVGINIILAVFNLIPIPPLDGSRIVESLLPEEQAFAFSRLQPYGTVLLFVLLYTGLVRGVLRPAAVWLYWASTGGPPLF